MFENFAFPSSPTSTKASLQRPLSPPPLTSSSSLSPSLSSRSASLYVPQDYYSTLTPPLSPLAVPSDTDFFTSNPLCSTLSSLSLRPRNPCHFDHEDTELPPSPPASSDSESDSGKESLATVRGKRQAFMRLQADEDTVRSLGELVQRLCPPSSDTRRKSSVVEGGGVVKKRSRSRVSGRRMGNWWEKAGRSVGGGLSCQNTRR